MTTTKTLPAVQVTNNSVLSNDVFYGHFETVVNGKRTTVSVSNHIKDVKKTYNFRAAAKCKAGFVNISEFESTPLGAIGNWHKNALVTLQVEVKLGDGKSIWFNVFTTKGGKWYSIDRGFLEVITVGTMRQSFPNMCDMSLWNLVGAKTWADKAFTSNQ